MVVKTQCKGHAFTGVEVGAGNVRRYFPRDIVVIELHLDHLLIQCGLAPEFWQGEPRFATLGSVPGSSRKTSMASRAQAPIPLALIPSGKNCFRLQPISAHKQPRTTPRRILSIRPGRKPLPDPEPASTKTLQISALRSLSAVRSPLSIDTLGLR